MNTYIGGQDVVGVVTTLRRVERMASRHRDFGSVQWC